MLGAEVVSPFMDLGVPLRIEYHLGHAAPVTEIDKDEAAVVPASLHPPHQDNRLPKMLHCGGCRNRGCAPGHRGYRGS